MDKGERRVYGSEQWQEIREAAWKWQPNISLTLRNAGTQPE